MFYWRIFGAWKKENKFADVIWRGLTPSMYVFFNSIHRALTNIVEKKKTSSKEIGYYI